MSSMFDLRGAAPLRKTETPPPLERAPLPPMSPARPPGFWRAVEILLRSARKRSVGRQKRQKELLNQKSKKNATDWNALATALSVLFMLVLNGLAAVAVIAGVKAGERVEAERGGKIVVSQDFLEDVQLWDRERGKGFDYVAGRWTVDEPPSTLDGLRASEYQDQAKRIAEDEGGSKGAIAARLKAGYEKDGARAFISSSAADHGMHGLVTHGTGALLGSLLLLLWAGMLVGQGEGLELDLQRQRHPMWEWLHAHPVAPGAIFLAEMLAPIAANPIYWGGPLFVAIVIGDAQGPLAGLAAALVVGVPLTAALACLGKALEIAITLRFPPRTRGAMIGLIGWFGYASMMVFFLALMLVGKVATALKAPLLWMGAAPWPWLRWFVGLRGDGTYSFALAMGVDVAAALAIGAAAVSFSVWGAERGLAGNFAAEQGPSRRKGEPRFVREPLYRKELLWFVRDRSAIVQTILIPITVASFQLFNLRWLIAHAQGAWNYLCGVAIFFGTYFLWILGPKSLQSEGQALWIALTWPRGLESLLKAKARLWSMISTAMVLLVLAYATWVFPRQWWAIALVGVGWFVFAGSMAQKAVTLVTVTRESGEASPIPRGMRWGAQLGMLTFAIGVVGQQWHIAVMGIVYSWMTAAAMWQNFRARLPYLYDPWSEVLPQPPTLMHAMVAISVLVEGGAVLAGVMVAVTGPGGLGVAVALGYAVCAVAVSVGLAVFLGNRNVRLRDVWAWKDHPREDDDGRWWMVAGLGDSQGWPELLMGVGGGLALGALGHAYMLGLWHIPAAAELLRKSQAEMANDSLLKMGYAVAAIAFAPWAEEYLFRGVLYRALDREWGGWKAVVGSAAFFAIYHPALAWPPVFALGAVNALLFKRTRRLAPCVLLHMAYNVAVLMGS